MLVITVSEEVRDIVPAFAGAAVYSRVKNNESSVGLWEEITNYISLYKSDNTLDSIKNNPVVAATRNAYKLFGKDPNRYRPSSEALCRRIIRDLPLYRINTLVDIINLVSIRTGYSIGGFDADKIAGDVITLGIGKENEPYESIGRGILNIHGLPVYRDAIGGIGTPTSDNERTKLDLNTTRLLAIFNGYNGKNGLKEATDMFIKLLHTYAYCEDEKVLYF